MLRGRHNNSKRNVKTGVGWMKGMENNKSERRRTCQSSSLCFCVLRWGMRSYSCETQVTEWERWDEHAHTHSKVFTLADISDIPDRKTMLPWSFIILHHLIILLSSVMWGCTMKIIVLAAQPEGVMFAEEAKYDLELIMILLSETWCNAAPASSH